MKTLVLDSTTKSVTVELAGAPATTQPSYLTAYADWTGAAFTPGETHGALNGATPVTIISAPAASTQRTIKDITIVNRDTAAVTLIISVVTSGTPTIVAKVTLQPLDMWTTDGTYDAAGNLKSIASSSAQMIADTIHAATSKTPLADADEFGIWDSVGLVLKKLTGLNLKATLKTYFDTLYVALTGNQTVAGVKTFSTPGGIIATGVNDGSAAAAGVIGEFIRSSPGVVSISNAAITLYTSITLTPGDWDISGWLESNSGTTNTYMGLFISTTTGSSAGTVHGYDQIYTSINATSGIGLASIPLKHVSISVNTTYYMNAQMGIAASNCFGTLMARRVR